MTVRFLIVTLTLLLLAGCGDRRVTREVVVEPEEQDAATPVPSRPAHPGGPPAAAQSPPVAPPGPGETAKPDAKTAKPAQTTDAQTGEVDLGSVRLTAPKSWVRKQPRVEFIRAEFSLPRAEGDSVNGRLTVSSLSGGTVESNLERWRGQFPDKPEKDKQETLPISGIQVTVVNLSGTYNDQRGPFSPPTPTPGYRMLGAIFTAGGQLHFIKAYGPAKTMAAHEAEFRAFVQSLKASS